MRADCYLCCACAIGAVGESVERQGSNRGLGNKVKMASERLGDKDP